MLPIVLILAACGWNLPDQDHVSLDGPLWDPTRAVATTDGLYVPLAAADRLVLVRRDGTSALVDLGEAAVRTVSLAPDGQTVAVRVEAVTCEVEDDRDRRRVDTIADCPAQDRVVTETIRTVVGGEEVASFEIDGATNTMRWSPDATHAIAWLDLERDTDLSGVVSLTTVEVLDLAAGTATTVPVGFAATDVLFDATGARAVVLSQSEVAVLDLTGATPVRDVTFSLTLDPDHVVVPVGVELTPDGRYALISVQGRGDLYVLDLELHSVNLVSLAGAPAAMVVDEEADRTVIVYGSEPVVEVLDHARFDIETIELDEPVTEIHEGPGFLVLDRPGGRDVYRFDPTTGDTVELRLQSGLESLHLAPTGEFAIAFTQGSGFGGRPGMEILDLRDDRGHSYPYLLEGVGLDVEFHEGEGALWALVLQRGADYVYELELYTAEATEIELDEPPSRIGPLPGDGFFVTHEAPLGFVSFLDPATGEINTASGFATAGLADPIGLADVEGE